MPVFTDQTGKELVLTESSSRIISVVPSQTELLYESGLDKEVIGIARFCIHPAEWFKNKKKVGGTKNLNLPLIHQLSPDLIIANKEENTKEQIEELSLHYPVWVSDINNLADAYDMILQLGDITGRKETTQHIKNAIQSQFSSFLPQRRLKAVYLIWQSPYMTIGRDTFIHTMLESAGFDNAFKDQLRYPSVTIEEIKMKKPEIILLSSEPFPFTGKHIKEIQDLLPGIRVNLVDGEMFSWYGSRLLKSTDYFQQLRKEIAV